MSFANPAFLYALGLLAIPVIIHLFNFRKFKKVFFTNVALLEEVKEQTQATSRLKNLLILLARLLALTALILAFAEPFIKNQNQVLPTGGTVAVYIDNSPSMSNKGGEGSLLTEAIDKGKNIISAYPENTSFILVTNNSGPKLQRELTREEALNEVELIKEGYGAPNLADIVKKQQAIANGKPISIFLISDFQASTTKPESLQSIKADHLSLVPVSFKTGNNLAIDSLWFSSPTHLLNGKEELSIQLANYGDEPSEALTVELFINGKPAGLTNTSIAANSRETVQLSYLNKQQGFNRCELKINDSPIQFDNSYFFAYTVNNKLSVIEIGGKEASPATKMLFGTDPDYLYTVYTEQNIDFNQLKADGCLILNGLENISSGLIAAVENKLNKGQSVAIFPAGKSNLESYNQLLGKVKSTLISYGDTSLVKGNKLEHKHPFFKNVFDKIPSNIDLPVSKNGVNTSTGSLSKAQPLLKLANGSNFLSVTPCGSGQLFLFNSPLSSGNFAQHGLFAPVMLRIAESSGYIQQLAYTIGDPKPINLNTEKIPQENLFKMRASDNREFIPEVRKNTESILLYPPSTELKAGIYNILGNNAEEVSAIGVNLPRTESDTKVLEIKDLEALCEKSGGKIKLLNEKSEKIGNEIKTSYRGQKLWKLFIALAFIFITIEILLTKWLK